MDLKDGKTKAICSENMKRRSRFNTARPRAAAAPETRKTRALIASQRPRVQAVRAARRRASLRTWAIRDYVDVGRLRGDVAFVSVK